MSLPCFPFKAASQEAGDLLPTFVTPDDAKAYISETDSGYNRLNATILASTVSPAFKEGWIVQLASWKTFATGARESVGWLNTKAVMEQTDRFARDLADWNTSFTKAGGVPVGPSPGQPGQGTDKPDLGGITNLVLAVGGVALLVILAPTLMRNS